MNRWRIRTINITFNIIIINILQHYPPTPTAIRGNLLIVISGIVGYQFEWVKNKYQWFSALYVLLIGESLFDRSR